MPSLSSTSNTKNGNESADTDGRQNAAKITEALFAYDTFQRAMADLSPETAEWLSQLLAGAPPFRLSGSNAPRTRASGTISRARPPQYPRKEQLDYAKDVLRKCPKGLHYRDLAVQALTQGCRYKGQSYSDGPIPEEVTKKFAHSINGAMNKCVDLENLGHGFFRLRGNFHQ